MSSGGACDKICKDEDYKEIRKRLNTIYKKEEKIGTLIDESFEEKMEALRIYGNKQSLNKIIGISCKNGQLEILRYIYDDLKKNGKKHLKLEGEYWYRRSNLCVFQTACLASNIEIVRYLLSIGISIGIDSNRINKGLEVCMHEIYFNGHDWNCAILLLENGGDVNRKWGYGKTLLSIACEKRNYEMVQNLCEKYSAKINEYDILHCFDNSPNKFKRNIDEGTKIAEFLFRKCDIDKFLKLLNVKFYQSKFKIDDDIYNKVMDMTVKEQKRRKQENIRNLLLIGYRKRPELHQDELRKIASFF